MAKSRASWSSKHGGAAAKTVLSSSRHESAASCMPSAVAGSSGIFPDAKDFPCFPYDAQAKCRLQEHVAGPQMCRSPPLYALLNLGSQARDESCFFAKLEIVDVGVWYGRGGSKKIAESSAAIAGLIDIGIDTLEQHSGKPAAQIVTIAPVVPKCTRQHPYDDQAKCRLQEFIVGRTMRLPAPMYTVHSISGPKNSQCFIVQMHIQKCGTWFGSGPSKKHAECSAAVSALVDLRVDALQQPHHRRQGDTQVDVASVREELPAPVAPDPLDFSVSEENIGFKLLVKHGWKEGGGLGKKCEGLLLPVDPIVPCQGHAGIGLVSKRNAMTVEAQACRELQVVQTRNSIIEHCYNTLWKEKSFSRVFCLELSSLVPDLPQNGKRKSSTAASKVLREDPRFKFCTNQRGASCVYLSSVEYAGFEYSHEPLSNFHRSDDPSVIGLRWIDHVDEEPLEMWPTLPVRNVMDSSSLDANFQSISVSASADSCLRSLHDGSSADAHLSALQTTSVSSHVPIYQNDPSIVSEEPERKMPTLSSSAPTRKSLFAPPIFSYQLDSISHSHCERPCVSMQASKREVQPAASPHRIGNVQQDSSRLILYRPPQARVFDATAPCRKFEVDLAS